MPATDTNAETEAENTAESITDAVENEPPTEAAEENSAPDQNDAPGEKHAPSDASAATETDEVNATATQDDVEEVVDINSIQYSAIPLPGNNAESGKLHVTRESQTSHKPIEFAEEAVQRVLGGVLNDAVEPEKAAANATTSPKAGEETANKPSLVTKLLFNSRKYAPIGGAAIGGILFGAILSFFTGASEDPASALELDEEVKPVYVATDARRSEPIQTVVPFAGLNPDIAAIGERMFFDQALSGDGRQSCASCHDPNNFGQDGKVHALPSVAPGVTRNTPSINNSGFNFVHGWDGNTKSLADQTHAAMREPEKMNSDWNRVVKYLNSTPYYELNFALHLGGEPTIESACAALVAYQRSLIPTKSKFDRWLQGDETALSADETAGYAAFRSLNCIRCHQGSGVGGTMLQSADSLSEHLAGRSNNGVKPADLGHFLSTGDDRDRNVFRVPSLRNVAKTAPYLHDGSVETLEEVVELMLEHECNVKPNEEYVRRIVAFLNTLTSEPE